jgi:transcriptional regulator with XRE-family HTH domain
MINVDKTEQDVPTLKVLRESASLTQPELSRRMGVGIRIIGDWERGEAIPRFDRAIALARELGVSLKTIAKSIGLNVEGIPDDEPMNRPHIRNRQDSQSDN